MKKILLIIISGCLPLLSFGQIKTCDASLFMVNASNDTLPFPFASIILNNGQNPDTSVQSDENGKFQLRFDPTLNNKLLISTNKSSFISVDITDQSNCNFYVTLNV